MERLRVFLLLCSFCSLSIISNAIDTITTAQSLTDGNTIVSSGGSFELGFFSPSGNSENRYLGIWYKKISKTVFWVANRDIPLTEKAGVLNLTSQGILTLFNSSNSIIWSSNSSRTTQNPVARLLESGNFVVGNDGDTQDYIWQSFDYPSNTFMPRMKLGRNLVSGVDRYLSSYKTNNNPSGGDYKFQLDPHGFPQLFLMKDSVEEFRSGPWNGLRFSGSPGLKPNPIYTYDFVFDNEEMYYVFELINSSVYSRVVLNEDGILQRYTWNYRIQNWVVYLNAPADNCDSYGLCNAYGSCNIANSPVCGCLNKFEPKYPKDWDRADWSNGCVRKTPLSCHNGEGFVKYSGIKLPDTRNSWYNVSMSLEECHKLCLENCSCMAYANSNIMGKGSGCLLWFGDLIDIRYLSENGQDIHIKMASSELDFHGDHNKRKKIREVSLVLLAVVLLLCLGLALYLWRKRKKKEMQEQEQQQEQLNREGRTEYSSEQYNISERQKEDLELPLLDLATIVKATNNFSNGNKLGEGGFGPVYMGILEDGQEIAVKRLSIYSLQGLEQLKNEVICIAKLQHRNLVKLLGCCIAGEEKLLIYEYMPNNSLETFIFDPTRSKLLDWSKRFNIINGIARGLLYLHQDSRLRIIHRDLKAANVLLDIDMNPKISDFGMARSFGGDETEANTKRVVGTYGYMSPEYAVDGIFSVKSDVFSFGVLVLEIVSGMKNRGFIHQDHHHNLLGHAWMLHNKGGSLEMVDPNLGESCYLSEVLRSIHVALLCVQQFPEDRPSMSSVVLMLGGEGALPQPKEPGFFTKRNLAFDYSSSTRAAISANEISMTLLDAR
ncbi:hypothetical protein LguiA_000822 [Lonicera macranthoides]